MASKQTEPRKADRNPEEKTRRKGSPTEPAAAKTPGKAISTPKSAKKAQKAAQNAQKAAQNAQPKRQKPEAKQKPKQKPAEKPREEQPRRQRTTAEWRKIRLEYVKGKTTLRELAEKYSLSESTIRKRASNEGWKKRKNKLDEKVEQKVLERACDARAKEFEHIAELNDNLGEALDNILSFIRQQPPKKYDDMRGVESLAKAINQIVQTKRDLYNIPSEVEKAKIEALREKNKLEREKWQEERAEKARAATLASETMWQVNEPAAEEGDGLDD